MSDIAIKVENLAKRYRLGRAEEQPDTLFGAMKSWLTSPLSNYRQLRRLTSFEDDERRMTNDERHSPNGHSSLVPRPSSLPSDIIWALKDVSFEVKHGEVVGIIGRNGAGKSTLLKIISRITKPTRGRVIFNGRVASLLEVGTGFHPELTGRENVYLNGTILGMTKAEVERKFDEIVDFSGVEQFIDTPVKRYSSGMQVRLAFAVAAHLEPEILLIDEVLAVGDLSFQKKCMGKMGDIAAAGTTVLLVSHNMASVLGLCTTCTLLEEGQVRFRGNPNEAVKLYQKTTTERNGFFKASHSFSDSDQDFAIRSVRLLDKRCTETTEFNTGDPLTVEVTVKTPANSEPFSVGIALFSHDGIYCYGVNTFLDNISLTAAQDKVIVSLRFEDLRLLDGHYALSVAVANETSTYVYDQRSRYYNFSVVSNRHDHGMYYLPHTWSYENIQVSV